MFYYATKAYSPQLGYFAVTFNDITQQITDQKKIEAINQELKELELILEASKTILKSGGRIVVVSFHSLEDRIVKNFFKKECETTSSGISRYQPNINQSDKNPSFFLKKSTVIITVYASLS